MKSSFLVLLFQITDSLEIVCIDLAIFQAGIWLNIIIKFNYFTSQPAASSFGTTTSFTISACGTGVTPIEILLSSPSGAGISPSAAASALVSSALLSAASEEAASVVAASVAAAVVSAALLPHPARTVIAAVAATANDNHLSS